MKVKEEQPPDADSLGGSPNEDGIPGKRGRWGNVRKEGTDGMEIQWGLSLEKWTRIKVNEYSNTSRKHPSLSLQ